MNREQAYEALMDAEANHEAANDEVQRVMNVYGLDRTINHRELLHKALDARTEAREAAYRAAKQLLHTPPEPPPVPPRPERLVFDVTVDGSAVLVDVVNSTTDAAGSPTTEAIGKKVCELVDSFTGRQLESVLSVIEDE